MTKWVCFVTCTSYTPESETDIGEFLTILTFFILLGVIFVVPMLVCAGIWKLLPKRKFYCKYNNGKKNERELNK